jgi:hypothetical protein
VKDIQANSTARMYVFKKQQSKAKRQIMNMLTSWLRTLQAEAGTKKSIIKMKGI